MPTRAPETSLWSIFQWLFAPVGGGDAELRHVADDEIADGDVTEAVIRPGEGPQARVARLPTDCRRGRPILADERVVTLRDDRVPQKIGLPLEAEGRSPPAPHSSE
jgi:hypothetical protein